jgi:hypothetical protein
MTPNFVPSNFANFGGGYFSFLIGFVRQTRLLPTPDTCNLCYHFGQSAMSVLVGAKFSMVVYENHILYTNVVFFFLRDG